MFKKIREALALARLSEESMYQEASDEIRNGVMREGLWAKAIAESKGNEASAKAIYIRLRVQALKDDLVLLRAASEAKEKEYFEKQSRDQDSAAEQVRREKIQQKSEEEVLIVAEINVILEEAGYALNWPYENLWEVRKPGAIFPFIRRFHSLSELRRFAAKVSKTVRR